jgi:hypothetical protein
MRLSETFGHTSYSVHVARCDRVFERAAELLGPKTNKAIGRCRARQLFAAAFYLKAATANLRHGRNLWTYFAR